MSSFNDNNQNMNMNEENNWSFYKVIFNTILMIIVTQIIIASLKNIISKFKKDSKSKFFIEKNYKNCSCKKCQERFQSYLIKEKKKKMNLNFLFQILLTIILCFLLIISIFKFKKNWKNMKKNDPFEILEIPRNASSFEIEQAYKNLSFKYNIDKNPSSQNKYKLIEKAYKSLINEKSGNQNRKKNFFGLIKNFFKNIFKIAVLLIIIILLFIIFPKYFFPWVKNTIEEYGRSNNTIIFFHKLQREVSLKQMPFILGLAKEYENLIIYGNEEKILTKTYFHYKDCMPPHKLDLVSPSNKKAICLLYSYLNRKELETISYKDDLENVLSYSNSFVETLYEISIFTNNKIVYEFFPILYQQIPYISNHFSAFFQLPYFDINKIKILINKNKINKYADDHFSDFLKMDNKSINEILSEEFNVEQIDDINKAIEAIPTYDMDIKVFSRGYDDIMVGDKVNIEITIIRNNLKEGQKVGLTHSLGFTESFDEKVIISIFDGKFLIHNSIQTITERKNIFIINFKAKAPKKMALSCELYSLNYKGINISKDYEFVIKRNY